MSGVKYIDNGVMCDIKGCYSTFYATQLDLPNESSLKDVRRELALQGWSTRRVETTGRTEDCCPNHGETPHVNPRA